MKDEKYAKHEEKAFLYVLGVINGTYC